MAYVPAPGYQPVYNPPIPNTTMIAGGLRPGMAVCIQAHLAKSYNRFTINFLTAESDTSDIALHMNPRYDGIDRVVFNSRRNGEWETEEKKKQMPFKSGKNFVILFEITQNNYLIFANGERFYEFSHRIPLHEVRWLNIAGDVVVQELSILGCGAGMKGSLVLSGAQANLPPMMGPPYLNPPVPFKAPINGGMILKRTVVIKGIPTGKIFSINLKSGNSEDISFHMSVRLSKGTLIRNSLINGEWGTEEKEVSKNPFKHGEYFEVSIRSGMSKFKVFVNGSHCFDYNIRFGNVQMLDTIEVNGDAKLDYVFC